MHIRFIGSEEKKKLHIAKLLHQVKNKTPDTP